MASGKERFALPPPKWRQSGQEPDYRFSLANERTFLAWIRSALAMMAGGVVLVQFATQLSPRWLVAWTGLALTGLAGLMAVLAYRQWRANEIAMRHTLPLPPSVAAGVVAAWVALVAVVMAATLWPHCTRARPGASERADRPGLLSDRAGSLGRSG